ncbi:DUF7133 domain-containing protein [Pollutibacter soli]|uniref:DUF7133 domain-containing protein n=1 Tax=Pollutibacter soli TaxID=3034157 RepID=UPI0030134938
MNRLQIVFSVLLLIILSLTLCSVPANDDVEKGTKTPEMNEPGFNSPRVVNQQSNTVPLSPEESLRTFRIPVGYHLELVASEPMISEPTAIAWDGNGRMYVAQMETYMQTIDAKDQYTARSRVMLLEDTDDDGRMDMSSVFIDQLMAPRMILCVGKELLVNETNSFDVFAYSDTNHDGRADIKRAVYNPGKNSYGNIEHQRSGFDWNLDNYIYLTTDPVRFRYVNGRLVADTLFYGNNGQWGLTHDDFGRLYFSRAAAGLAATGFEINPSYGQLEKENKYEDSVFRVIWPIGNNADVNGGPAGLRPDSTLERFTSVCGQSVFRGDRLPVNMRGDYFAAEPVGRIIRRAKIISNHGRVSLKKVYEQDEFIASSDMNFRPVNTYTGPDGCLYIVDMYRGIIQESTWAQPGTYLFDQIKQKNLDKNISRGRIYRLVHDDFKRGPKPNMLHLPSDSLVAFLTHPNGWWRDNAQKELVIRGDKSVVTNLKEMVSGKSNSTGSAVSILGRIHALWTLEGLNALDEELLISVLNDRSPELRKQAVWISEHMLNTGNTELISKLKDLADDESYLVREQLVLTMNKSNHEDLHSVAAQIMSAGKDTLMFSAINKMFEKNIETKKYGSTLVVLKEADRKRVLNGAAIFSSLCASCHGSEGQGLPTQVAPPLVSKFKLVEKKEELIKILLHGLSGPVDGKTYPDIMPPMKANDNEWIASVCSFIRFDLCLRSFPKMSEGFMNWMIVKPEDVEKIRKKNETRNRPWTWEELGKTGVKK